MNKDRNPSTHVSLGQKPPSEGHSTTNRHAFSFFDNSGGPVSKDAMSRATESGYISIVEDLLLELGSGSDPASGDASSAISWTEQAMGLFKYISIV